MGFRFRKSVKILGCKINLSKTGVSLSIGGAPLTVNVSSKGTRVTASAPGTGFSWSQFFRRKK